MSLPPFGMGLWHSCPVPRILACLLGGLLLLLAGLRPDPLGDPTEPTLGDALAPGGMRVRRGR